MVKQGSIFSGLKECDFPVRDQYCEFCSIASVIKIEALWAKCVEIVIESHK